MLIKFVFCMCMLIVPWVLVVFCLRCRARVAPPVDEIEIELSFWDEFLPPEPPARHRGRSTARSRPHVISRRRRRNLQDYEPAEQDDVNAEFVAETLKDAEPIPPAVPLMQPMFQHGAQVMSDPEAALFYAKVGRVAFDGTSNPLDFLHAIETRTRTTHTEY